MAITKVSSKGQVVLPKEAATGSVNGGAPIVLCDAPAVVNIDGGTWTADDTIIFSDLGNNLAKVAAAGGAPQVLIKKDSEARMVWPALLPGGNAWSSRPNRAPRVELSCSRSRPAPAASWLKMAGMPFIRRRDTFFTHEAEY
jgi:hypothetical protein